MLGSLRKDAASGKFRVGMKAPERVPVMQFAEQAARANGGRAWAGGGVATSDSGSNPRRVPVGGREARTGWAGGER